jgi:hypothetical protein
VSWKTGYAPARSAFKKKIVVLPELVVGSFFVLYMALHTSAALGFMNLFVDICLL